MYGSGFKLLARRWVLRSIPFSPSRTPLLLHLGDEHDADHPVLSLSRLLPCRSHLPLRELRPPPPPPSTSSPLPPRRVNLNSNFQIREKPQQPLIPSISSRHSSTSSFPPPLSRRSASLSEPEYRPPRLVVSLGRVEFEEAGGSGEDELESRRPDSGRVRRLGNLGWGSYGWELKGACWSRGVQRFVAPPSSLPRQPHPFS